MICTPAGGSRIGSLVPVGKDAESEEWQHRNYGKVLISRAEEIPGLWFLPSCHYERNRVSAPITGDRAMNAKGLI